MIQSLIFSAVFFCMNTQALPTNEAEIPKLQGDMLNFGSLTLSASTNEPATADLYQCKNAWGFPLPGGCTLLTNLNLNERTVQPGGWYFVKFNMQSVPIFIMPEGGIQTPALSSSVIDPLAPVDQIFNIAKIANGANIRTELTFKYRADYQDPGMLNAALFYLHAGMDNDFNVRRKAFRDITCSNLVDLDEEPNLEKMKICQSLASPDPSNLIGTIVQVSASGDLERLVNVGKFRPFDSLNDTLLEHDTSSWKLGMPGSYLLQTENPSLGTKSEVWMPVTAGGSALQSMYAQPRPWKALTSEQSSNYLLTNVTATDLTVWSCPSTFVKLIGSLEASSSEVQRICNQINIHAHNPGELAVQFDLLRSKYQTETEDLNRQIPVWNLDKQHLQTQITSTRAQVSPLEESKKAIEAQLNSNVYFKTEQDHSILTTTRNEAIEHQHDIESAIAIWMQEAPARIQELTAKLNLEINIAAKGLVGIAALGLAVLCIGSLFIPGGGIGGAIVIGTFSTLAGVPLAASAIKDLGVHFQLSETKTTYQTLIQCAPKMDTCPKHPLLSPPWSPFQIQIDTVRQMLSDWRDTKKKIEATNQQLAEIEQIRLTEEYRLAKESAEGLSKDVATLQSQIDSLSAQVTAFQNAIVDLEARITSAQERLSQIPTLVRESLALGLAFSESLSDPHTRIVRSTCLKELSVNRLIQDLSEL